MISFSSLRTSLLPLPGCLFILFIYIYLFLAVLVLGCCMGFSLVEASRGYFLIAVCSLLIVVASLIAEHGL